MHWSIRNQILVPLIAIQALAVASIAIATATLAARRSERQIIDRLNGVIGALGNASFPYTSSVLARMRGLSGAHFVAETDDGRGPETSFPAGGGGTWALPPSLRSVPTADHLDSLGTSPTVRLGGTRHYAVRLRPSGRPRGSSLVVLYPETNWRQARRDAALPCLLLGAGSLGMMVLVTSWIAHRIGLRVRRLQLRVALIASGDFRDYDPGR